MKSEKITLSQLESFLFNAADILRGKMDAAAKKSSFIKTRIRQAQNRAVMSAIAEMLRFYWDIGYMVFNRQGLEGWGKGLLRQLAIDIKTEVHEINGFSERNLQLMIQFQREYPGLFENPQRPVSELPEASIADKIRPQHVAEFDPNDSEQSAQSPGVNQIVQRVVAQLPEPHAQLAKDTLKDPSNHVAKPTLTAKEVLA